MLSMTCFSAIKCAVEVCLHPQLKNDLLLVNPLEFDAVIVTERYRKRKWTEMVKKSATEILAKATFGNRGLPKIVREDILDFVIPVARKMLTWSEYHHRKWNIPRALLSRNLRSDVFTDRGIIDNEKAAEGLLDDRLTLPQRYGVVCSYCLKERILPVQREIGREMSPTDWNMLAFSYYLDDGRIHDVIEGKEFSKNILEHAVRGGNKAVVKSILQEYTERDALVDIAVDAIAFCRLNNENDWIPFSPFTFLLPPQREELDEWVPSYYYLGILCFLFSKMDLDQRKECLCREIAGPRYGDMVLDYIGSLTILDCFLKYPYQNHVTDTVKLLWEFLPENNYAVLLLKICDRVESSNDEHIDYGEEKSFDYLGILRELWNESPENFRKYVLSNQKVVYVDEREYVVKAGEFLLVKLLALENFRTAVKNIIKLILTKATAIEKENIIISGEVISICCELSKKKRWDVLEWFLQNCFSTDEERNSFTKKVIYTKSGHRVFIDFLTSSNWDAVRDFTKWGALNEDEVNKFKEDVIHSVVCAEALMKLYLDDNTKVADEILNRCLPSGKAIEEYKGELALSDTGERVCNFFLVNENTELAENWFSWCRLSQEKIEELKNISLWRVVSFVIDILKSDNSDLKNAKFEGGKWERTEKFLTWCYKSEIKYCKKVLILSEPGERLLYDLINSYRYEEAEELLKWLNLSDDEIRRYRLETANIFVEEWIARAFVWNETVGDDDYEIEGFDTLLDWCLRSEDQVRSFRDGLRSRNTLRMSCGQRRVKERFLSKAEEILEELIAKRIKT